MIRTVHAGFEIKLGESTKIEITKIDPHGKWVRVQIDSKEHVKIQAAQHEPTNR